MRADFGAGGKLVTVGTSSVNEEPRRYVRPSLHQRRPHDQPEDA